MIFKHLEEVIINADSDSGLGTHGLDIGSTAIVLGDYDNFDGRRYYRVVTTDYYERPAVWEDDLKPMAILPVRQAIDKLSSAELISLRKFFIDRHEDRKCITPSEPF